MATYFTILIGNYGLYFRLNKSKMVVHEKFFKEFNDQVKEELRSLLLEHSRAKVYVLLDNIGQNYSLKKFPKSINIFDLHKVVNRKFNFETPSEDLRTKLFLGKNDTTKEWEYLFVSSPVEPILNDIIAFIETVPNLLAGIYMAPLESTRILKELLKQFPILKKKKWILLLVETKVSGIRQIAFRNQKLVFTRFLYDINNAESDIKTKTMLFENDIARTNGFIKRFDADFKSENLSIIGITTSLIKNVFNRSDLKTINSMYFDTSEILARLFKTKFNREKEIDYEYADIVYNNLVTFKRNIFKFFTPSTRLINLLLKIDHILKNLIYLALLIFTYLAVGFCIVYMSYFFDMRKVNQSIKTKTTELDTKKNVAILKKDNIHSIIDLGLIHEFLQKNKLTPFDDFKLFAQLMPGKVTLSKFKWQQSGFDAKNFKNDYVVKATWHFSGSLMNNYDSGSAETLLENYESFKSSLEKGIKKKLQIKTLTFDKNKIDFNKFYSSAPITFELESL